MIKIKEWNESENKLFKAISNGDVLGVKQLVEGGVPLNSSDEFGTSAFIKALQHSRYPKDNFIQIAQILADAGADINAVNIYGATALHMSARHNKKEVVEFLLGLGADINILDQYKRNAIYEAVRCSNIDITKLLVTSGGDINNKDIYGDTILHTSVLYENHDIIKLLINLGIDVNSVNADKMNPIATIAGRNTISAVETVKILFENKADINNIDIYGETALFKSINNTCPAVMLYLLSIGADINIVDNFNGNILYKAVKSGNLKAIKIILKTGVNVNAVNNNGWSPLHMAMRRGSIAIIQSLIKYGADLYLKDNGGNTPLYILKDSHFSKYYNYETEIKNLFDKVQSKRLNKEDKQTTIKIDFDFNI